MKCLNYLQSFGIPCPKTHFIYGNLGQLRWSKEKNVLQQQKEWLDEYGPIVGYYMGVMPRILVSDLEILKEILIKQIDTFTNRPDVPRGQPTLISLRDLRWKEIRHILTPTFSSHKLKLMFPLMNLCVDDMSAILHGKTGTECDIYEIFQGLTLDVICRCALALKINCQRNPQDEILQAVRNLFKLDLSRIVVLLVCFPGLRYFFRLLFRFAPSHGLLKFVLGHLQQVIQERRAFRSRDPILVDALQLLLEASNCSRDGSVILSDDEIIWNACIFLLAGYETTSTALAYVCHCLSVHPDIQQKVYEEIESVMDAQSSSLTYEDVNKLRYTEMVILEAMRLYPPVPLFVSRECKETVKIGGFTFPQGAVVDVPVWHIHRDPALWVDPLKFDPLRHESHLRSQRHQLSFLPFGCGPRNCIGERFALLEMKVTLARLVGQFRLQPCCDTSEPIPTVVRTTIMNPADGVRIRLERRL